MWYLYKMEFYSTTEKYLILSFADKCIKLKNIIVIEVSQVQKAKSHVLSHTWNTNIYTKHIIQIQIQGILQKQLS
jgi:hypothetical protein